MEAKKRKLDFREVPMSDWGKGTERTSEEIDVILYGDLGQTKKKRARHDEGGLRNL